MSETIQYSLDNIPFRSVWEKRLADSILSREGVWDKETETFLTKEKLLQDLTKRFGNLRSLLRHAPAQAYVAEGKDLNAVYPKCPRLMMRQHTTNNSQLSLEDPTKQNIEFRRQLAAKNTAQREKDSDSNRSSGVFEGKERQEWIERLEQEFARLSRGGPSGSAMTHSTSRIDLSTQQTAATSSSTGLSHLDRSATSVKDESHESVPKLRDGKRSSSSLLMQLKKTRDACRKMHGENTIVQSILTMEASATMKDAITRMFADPQNADRISKEEEARRELEYEQERQRAAAYQNDLLREERETIERELARFK